MRPIDADEVKLPKGFFENVTTVPRFYGWLDTIPTIDAAPIVRCKDCRYFLGSDAECALILTRLHFYEKDKRWTEESYCSWGERKDNE